MKLILLVPALLLMFSTTASGNRQQDVYDVKLVLKGMQQIAGGEVLDRELLVAGGAAEISPGSRVNGSVYVTEGAATINGTVSGNVYILAGSLALGPKAVVEGDVLAVGGKVVRSPDAVVRGVFNEQAANEWSQVLLPRQPLTDRLAKTLALILVLSGLAYFLARRHPRILPRISGAIIRHYLVSGATGFITIITGMVLLVFMGFTLVLLPLSLVAAVLGLGAVAYGWLGFGAAVGQCLQRRLPWRLTPPAATAGGVAVFMLLLEGLNLIPVIGDAAALCVLVLGFGAVLLTRFGTRAFVPSSEI